MVKNKRLHQPFISDKNSFRQFSVNSISAILDGDNAAALQMRDNRNRLAAVTAQR